MCIRVSLQLMGEHFNGHFIIIIIINLTNDRPWLNCRTDIGPWQAIGVLLPSQGGPNLRPQKDLSKGWSVKLTIHLYLAPKFIANNSLPITS